MNLMLEQQYSPGIAKAQRAGLLETVFSAAKKALLSESLPDPLAKTGLRYSEVDDTVYVEIHGRRLVMRYDHVWLQDSGVTRLGGRLRFVAKNYQDDDADEILVALFDELGNTRFGEDGYYNYNCAVDDERPQFVRNLSIEIINAVHRLMDVVE